SPRRAVQKWSEVIVPLAGTFLWVVYLYAPPRPMLLASLPRFAVLVSTSGYLLAMWAMAEMGRSFGVLLSVRRIVDAGPYRFVDHPSYWGYALQLLGVFLAWPSLAYLVLTVIYLGLLVWRAQLEDAALADWRSNCCPSSSARNSA